MVAPDPEAEALRAKLAELEAKVDELTLRHTDMTQRVQQYQTQQYLALGQLVRECLELRSEWARIQAERSASAEDAEAARAAEEEFATYERVHEGDDEPPHELGDTDQEELKRLYRSAAMRCHPDRVDAARRDAAHDLFLRTQQAYARGDLDALRDILRILADEFATDAGTVSGANGSALRRAVSRRQIEAADLILAIQTLQLDPSYRSALTPEKWDAEFALARGHFEAERDQLRGWIARAG
jgi:hypothetical protein